MDLPTLKKLSLNDPLAYKNEILSRLDYFYAKLETTKLRANIFDRELASLASFLALVSYKLGFGEQLCSALIRHLKEDLNQKTRDVLLTATFTLRSKKSVNLSMVLPTWLKLIELKDKKQRERLLKFLINDLVLAHKRGEELNVVKKLFLDRLKASITSSSGDVISSGKFVLTLMIKLFHRGIWKDQITANAMSECTFAVDKKIAAAGSRLVLDMSFKPLVNEDDVPVVPISIIDYLRDPHGYATTLLKRSCGDKVSFNLRIMLLNVCTRVIGHYKLIIPSVYPQIAKYLNPKQRMVTNILAYLLQATHELVPPDMLHPIMDILSNQFIAYDRPNPVILTGLYTVRELIRRSPQCLSESIREYIKDFIKYRHKEISAVSKSIAGKNVKVGPEYGHVEVHKGVDGEELLCGKKSISLTRIFNQKDFQIIKKLKSGEMRKMDGKNTSEKCSYQPNGDDQSVYDKECNDSDVEDNDNDGLSELSDLLSYSDKDDNEISDEDDHICTERKSEEEIYFDSSDASNEVSSYESGGEMPMFCVDPETLKFGNKKNITRAEKRAEIARIIAEKKSTRKLAISKHGKRQSLSKKVQARNKPIMMAIQSKRMKKKRSMNVVEKAQALKRHIKNLSKGRINKKKRRE